MLFAFENYDGHHILVEYDDHHKKTQAERGGSIFMAADVRNQMVQSAMTLLARLGLDATSFPAVLKASGAPRGSLYHHFPAGKDEMVQAAVDLAGAILLSVMEKSSGASAEIVVRDFLALWRHVLTQSECASGCAVLAVSVASDSPELLSQAATVFREWRHRLTQLLVLGGLKAHAAKSFATVLIASTEGAVVLARAERSLEPFELVASALTREVRRLAEQA